MKAADNTAGIGIIRTGVRIIDADNRVIEEHRNPATGLPTEDFFMTFLDGKLYMFLCGTLFNTVRLREAGGLNSRHQLWQDVYAEFQLAARFGRLDVPDIKASFRKHLLQNTFNVNIKHWCEDSLFLLDAMCGLVPEKSALIRNEGMRYFSRHNFDIANRIESTMDRLKAFFVVYKEFHFQYLPPAKYIRNTPLHYVYSPLYSIKKRIDTMFLN